MAKLKFGDTDSCPAMYKTQEFVGIPREIKNGYYQMPTENFTFSLPNNVTDVNYNGLRFAFYNCEGLKSVDLSSLTTISGYGLTDAFYGCLALASVDLSSLTTVGNYGLSNAFGTCGKLTSMDFPSLTTVSSYGLSKAFQFCTKLIDVYFRALTTVSDSFGLYYAFQGCTGLTDVYFRALTTSSFGSSKNQFNNMMVNTGSTTTHTLHFPSNLQSTISGLNGYPLFGGTSGYVVLSFDLPATS